jgi:hypothetical protein
VAGEQQEEDAAVAARLQAEEDARLAQQLLEVEQMREQVTGPNSPCFLNMAVLGDHSTDCLTVVPAHL